MSSTTTEQPTPVTKKPAKFKRRRTNLSRSTRNAKEIKLKRKNESPEERAERNKKSYEYLKIRRAAENAEEMAARNRRQARRRKQFLEQKRRHEKRERTNALIKSIECGERETGTRTELNHQQTHNTKKRVTKKKIKANESQQNPTIEIDIEQVVVKMKQEPSNSDTEEDALHESNFPLEVLIKES